VEDISPARFFAFSRPAIPTTNLAGKKETTLANLVPRVSGKSIFQLLFNRTALTLLAPVTFPFTQNTVFAERDLAGSNDFEPQSDKTLQGWLETQPWWWMLKERSSPSAVPLDGPTLSQRNAEAVAQMERLPAAKFEG
jgi:hypothetical protein